MKTTIEINGKTYDARTGKVVSTTTAAPTSTLTGQANANVSKIQPGVVMDGVRRQRPSVPRPQRAVATPPPHAPHATVMQKSQTLHRKAVKKPTQKLTNQVHATSSSIQSRVETSATGRGMLLKRVPEVRLTRAMAASKSNLVSKFQIRTTISKPQLSTELTVKQPPKQSANHTAQQTPRLVPITPSTPIKETAQHQPATNFVFEDHLKNANSHLQKPVKKSRVPKHYFKKLHISPKIVSVSAAAFAIVLLGGFFAYQNVPAVSMRVAASKAGFSGKLPNKVPAGYSFNGPVVAQKDNIALNYQSNSDDRRFIVVQKPTDWSSEALLTNFLVDSQSRYQVYRDKGLTVYIYDGSNATWVDKGIWFNVNGEDGSLSSEQLLELASSI